MSLLKPEKKNYVVLSIAMLAALGSIPEVSAMLNQAILSFTPSGEIKPRVQSMVSQLSPGMRYMTGASDMREVLLQDGTVITLGLGSEVIVEEYAYSRQRREGQIVIYVASGLVRIIGGLINNSSPILVRTPTAELSLYNAAATINVARDDGRTRASLLYGQSLSMSSGGRTETLLKPGFELISVEKRSAPAGPSMQDEQVALADMASLETLQLSKMEERGDSGQYFYPERNKVSRINTLATEDQPVPVPELTPVPVTNPPPPPEIVAGGLASSGFGPGLGGDASRTTSETPSQSDGDQLLLPQNLDKTAEFVSAPADAVEEVVPGSTRDEGRTANRLFNTRESFTQALAAGETPLAVSDSDNRLQYAFSSTGAGDIGGLTINLDGLRDLSELTPAESFDVTAPFLLVAIELPVAGQEVFAADISTITDEEFFESQRGSIFKNATHFEIVQAGFAAIENELGVQTIERQSDNFLLVEVRPGKIDRRFRDQIKDDFVISEGGVDDPVGFVNSVGIPVRLRFSNEALRTTQQVDLIANEVLTLIDDLGITATDVKPVSDPGYAAYIAKIQPLLNSLTELGDDASNNISSDIIGDIRTAFEGLDFDGFVVPTVDVDALQLLSVVGSEVSDPIAFLNALGVSPNFSLTSQDVDSLAMVIADAEVETATELIDADLAFGFLNANDKNIIKVLVNDVLATSLDPTATERFLFATGDVDARLDTGFSKQFSVDRFLISAGLENFAQIDDTGRTLAEGIRAFLREQTGLDLILADTGLLVVNADSVDPDAQDAVLHADFGLAGTGSAQQSTISVTIGDVEYQVVTCGTCDVQDSVEAVVSGHTTGSSNGTVVTLDEEGDPTDTVASATVAFSSPLRSTATGGGNPALNRDGYAGYFVLENYDPDPQDASEAALNGGTERPIGDQEAAQPYAYLRLATATGSSATGGIEVSSRSDLDLRGWVAGLGERETASGIQIVQLDSDTSSDNFVLRTDADSNRISANISFRGEAYEPMTLGGLSGDGSKGTSAFVDDDRFAARTPDSVPRNAALVSGELVKGGLPAELQAAIPDYQYLKWGFFFGDTLNDSDTQIREHVHLASWVAGRVPDPGDLPSSGSATYAGHAIGNVFNKDANYTAVGTYTNSWNFAQRTGSVDMQFDRVRYTGNTALINGTANFQGRIEATERVGGLHGNFVQGGGDPAAGVVGRFSIQETAGATYRASGTFGAEKQ